MLPIKYRITYIFTKEYLRVRIAWNGTRLHKNTGFIVNRTDSRGKPLWDGRRCKPGSFHGPQRLSASRINRALDELEHRIENAFYRYEVDGVMPSAEDLKSVLQDEKKESLLLKDAYDVYLRESEKRHGWSYNTVRSAKSVGNLFDKFKPRLRLADMTEEILADFAVWQQSHKLSEKTFERGQKGYANNVIAKNCRVFGWFLRWAEEKGYIKNLSATFKPSAKAIARPVVYLEWEELMKFESMDFGTEEMNRARDFFCFMCFTSLRYSDASALKKSAVKKDYFDIVTQKTSDRLRINLNDHSRAILNRYKKGDSEFALPRITNNRLNKLLKDMGKAAGFNSPVTISQYYGAKRVDATYPKYKLLSAHCGRRTFISNAISMGIAPVVVMQWTGHSEFTSLKPYLAIADKQKEDDMRRFNKTASKQGAKRGTGSSTKKSTKNSE